VNLAARWRTNRWARSVARWPRRKESPARTTLTERRNICLPGRTGVARGVFWPWEAVNERRRVGARKVTELAMTTDHVAMRNTPAEQARTGILGHLNLWAEKGVITPRGDLGLLRRHDRNAGGAAVGRAAAAGHRIRSHPAWQPAARLTRTAEGPPMLSTSDRTGRYEQRA
jgi:hypothetical protein